MRKSQNKELKERELEILKKEKEFNNKINFKEKIKRVKKENKDLNERNKNLEKEIKEKESILSKIKKQLNINNKNSITRNSFSNLTKLNIQRYYQLSNNISFIDESIEISDPLSEYVCPSLIGLNNNGVS